MKVVFKYVLFPVTVFLFLALLTVVVAPVLFNVQKLVPRLEKEISESTGRPFSLGPDLSISFFPWLSLTFSDLKLGNPKGFSEDPLLRVRSFEARIKVLPLLRNQVEISRFVVGGLALNLERRADGSANWQGMFDEKNGQPPSSTSQALIGLLSRLSFSVLAVTDGQVRWRDAHSQSEHQADDIMLLLNDFTPNKAVSVDAKATLDGKALAIDGKVGPLVGGGEEKINLDLGITLLNRLKGKFVGTLAAGDRGSSLVGTYEVPAFSLPSLAAGWGLLPPPAERGERALGSLSLQGGLRFGEDGLFLENGIGKLDDTALTYTLAMARRDTPFEGSLHLDRLDLKRYLPLWSGKDGDQGQQGGAVVTGLLGGAPAVTVAFDRLDYGSIAFEDLQLPVSIRDRRLLLNGISGKVAGGTLTADLSWSPEEQERAVSARLSFRQVDSATFLRQWLGKEGIQALFDAEFELLWEAVGGSPALERLRGEGGVTLGKGMLVGGDLTKPLVVAESGAMASASTPPTTPFSAGRVSVAIGGGVAQIREAFFTLANGELRCSGAVDLLQERLELETASTISTVVVKRGREGRVIGEAFHSITGPIVSPEIVDRQGLAARADSRTSAKRLVAETLPTPTGEGLGNLVGKDLVDPAVVAERFRLQPEVLQAVEMKKKMPLGEGRIHLGELRQE